MQLSKNVTFTNVAKECDSSEVLLLIIKTTLYLFLALSCRLVPLNDLGTKFNAWSVGSYMYMYIKSITLSVHKGYNTSNQCSPQVLSAEWPPMPSTLVSL